MTAQEIPRALPIDALRQTFESAMTAATQTLTEGMKLFLAQEEVCRALLAELVELASLESLKVPEAAALLHRSEASINDMCNDGRLVRIDERVMVWSIRDYEHGKRPAKKGVKSCKRVK